MGLSLSDQYWICPADKEITWSEVNFFENDFSPDVGNILFGKKTSAKKVSSFEWIDFDSLKGIEEEFREVVKGSPFVDKTKCDAICMAVRRRCEMLYETAKERSKKRQP